MIGVLAVKRAPQLFNELVMIGPSPRYLDDDGYVGGFTEAQIHELVDFWIAITWAGHRPWLAHNG